MRRCEDGQSRSLLGLLLLSGGEGGVSRRGRIGCYGGNHVVVELFEVMRLW